MTFSNPIELDTPENYPALDAVYDDDFSVNKTELYRQLGCMPELALEAHDLLRGEHGGEIPGVSAEECGNYRDHDLKGAKEEAAKMYEVLFDWTADKLTYPKK